MRHPTETKSEDRPRHHRDRFIVRACFFALGSVLIHLFWPGPLATNIAAIVIFALVVGFRLTPTLVGLSAFLIITFLFIPEPLPLLRISLFALLIGYTSALRTPPAPFMILSIFWIALGWVVLGSQSASHQLGIQDAPQGLVGAYIEIVGTLLATLLIKAINAEDILGKQSNVSTQNSMISHLIGLPCLTTIPLVIFTIKTIQPEPLVFTIIQGEGSPEVLAICFLTILIMVSAVTRLINFGVQHGLTSVAGAAVDVLQDDPTFAKKFETDDVRNYMRLIQQNYRQMDSLIARSHQQLALVVRKLERRSNALKSAALRLRRLRMLSEVLPQGVLLLSSDGYILDCNRTFCQLLEIRYRDIMGKHFSYLKGSHIWSKEVSGAIADAYQERSRNYSAKPFLHSTSSYQNNFLEITTLVLPVIKGTKRSPEETSKEHAKVGASVFIQKRADMRSFVMQNLQPGRISILGSSVISYCRKLNGSLEQLLVELNGLVPHWAFSDGQFSPKTAQIAITTVRKGLEEHVAEIGSVVSDIDAQLNSDFAAEKTLLNLTAAIINSLELYVACRGETEKPIVQNVLSATGESQLALSSHTNLRSVEGDVFLLAVDDELSRLLGLIVALFRNIDVKARDINVTICYENMTVDSCRIFNSASPGTYVRISFNLAGKGFSEKLSRRPFSSIKLVASTYYLADAIIDLTSLQLKRMGGFLTVQGSNTRGAILTAYLPHEDTTDSLASTPPRTAELPAQALESAVENSQLEILVVGHKDQRMEQFHEALSANECRVTHQALGELLNRFEEVDMSPGLGFEDPQSSSMQETVQPFLFAKTNRFDLVFLELPEKEIRARLLYQFLRTELVAVNTIILTSPTEELEEFKEWVKVAYPIPMHQLHTMLEKVREYKDRKHRSGTPPS